MLFQKIKKKKKRNKKNTLVRYRHIFIYAAFMRLNTLVRQKNSKTQRELLACKINCQQVNGNDSSVQTEVRRTIFNSDSGLISPHCPLILSNTLSTQRRLWSDCPGWSEFSLGALVILLVLSCSGSLIFMSYRINVTLLTSPWRFLGVNQSEKLYIRDNWGSGLEVPTFANH